MKCERTKQGKETKKPVRFGTGFKNPLNGAVY